MNDDRAAREWRANKNKKSTRKRPELNHQQRIIFLEMVARMASRSEFERRLDLTPNDVIYYKKQLDVESQDEARRLARRLKTEKDSAVESRALEEMQKAQEAAEIAQARLDALEAKKAKEAAERPHRKVDINKVKHEDAERQRRFAEAQAGVAKPKQEWQLPLEEKAGTREEQIDRFRREIIYHGLSFVRRKYGATSQQVKYEAARLGLRINWDIVRS